MSTTVEVHALAPQRSSAPAVSVLMPVHNGAASVEPALRTTLRALRPCDRVLVLDDGSTDTTWEVLREVAAADRRVRVLRQHPNRGVAESLNVLLEQADTELVARMDADDLVLPWRFELQRRAVGPGCDVVFSTVVHRASGRRGWVPQLPTRICGAAVAMSLLLGNPLAHSTMLARREVLVEAGGYRTVPSEDYDLWLRLVLADRRIRRLAVPTIVYQSGPQQVTASAAWTEAARTNPLTAKAHAHLLRRELGWEQDDTFTTLRSQPGTRTADDLRQLLTAVERRARRVPAVRSFALRRQVRTLSLRWGLP